MPPRITAHPIGEHITVTVAGALDTDAVAELRAFVLEALGHGWIHLAIDLRRAESPDLEAEAGADTTLAHIVDDAHRHGGCCHVVPPGQFTVRGELASPCLSYEAAAA